MIRPLIPTILLSQAILLILTTLPAAALDLHGSLDLSAGGIDHPLGLADEPSTSLRSARLQLSGLLPEGGAASWRASYQGDLALFGPELPLDYTVQAVGLERLSGGGAGRNTSGWGFQWSTRRQLDAASPYDHDQFETYLTAKRYLRPTVMLRTTLGARLRRFGELPEESFVEPHATLELKRFGADRSTLGAVVRLGGKWFHDDVAPAVWGTDGAPHAAQLSASLQYARSLSQRLGLRLSATQRVGLADFPYWVEDDLVDSPLLDRYARTGPRAAAALKILAPGGVWLDTGLAWQRDDYGAILFRDGDATATRLDTLLQAHLTLEAGLGGGPRAARLQTSVFWQDQDSSIAGYTWRGATLVAGVAWSW